MSLADAIPTVQDVCVDVVAGPLPRFPGSGRNFGQQVVLSVAAVVSCKDDKDGAENILQWKHATDDLFSDGSRAERVTVALGVWVGRVLHAGRPVHWGKEKELYGSQEDGDLWVDVFFGLPGVLRSLFVYTAQGKLNGVCIIPQRTPQTATVRTVSTVLVCSRQFVLFWQDGQSVVLPRLSGNIARCWRTLISYCWLSVVEEEGVPSIMRQAKLLRDLVTFHCCHQPARCSSRYESGTLLVLIPKINMLV